MPYVIEQINGHAQLMLLDVENSVQTRLIRYQNVAPVALAMMLGENTVLYIFDVFYLNIY